MTEKKETDDDKKKKGGKKTLSLSGKGTLSLKAGGAPKTQSLSTGRSSSKVAVEVRRKRGTQAQETPPPVAPSGGDDAGNLTQEEREARSKALREAMTRSEEEKNKPAPPALSTTNLSSAREREESERRKAEEEAERLALEEQRLKSETAQQAAEDPSGRKPSGFTPRKDKAAEDNKPKRKLTPRRGNESQRRGSGKITVTQALNVEYELERDRGPSLAAQRRARERERMRTSNAPIEHTKQVREIIIPEVITAQELANRMAERTADVVKKLMELGVMATATQPLDADTAELVTQEFGHTPKRVSESDVELGMGAEETDDPADMQPRPPVVTIMGHVDHGKTSLLDAMRQTDVVAGEAGGITQHIGAYQISLKSGQKITFLDTPGHAAFTEMRARGADVTDIVILVVAADDSIMPQTIEAINHAKAAEKPVIIAINKCDLPAANPDQVRNELLQHEIVVEEMGGDVLTVEVSALNKTGLDKLEEAIILQSEILELKANPNRTAQGAVVEARLEQGRGSVATVLIRRGTLRPGEIFATGAEWGRVRAIMDDRGNVLQEALPGQPVEILGLNGTPDAGDDFAVVEDESKARQIASYRQRKKREKASIQGRQNTVESMFSQMGQTAAKELPVVIKADVHGSVEAIAASLKKLTEENEEVQVNVLHTAVGGITESDVTLANASNALIIAFNVRPNAQAREMARRDGTQIKYYSVIYEAIDDVKALLGGMLSPHMQENFIGYAEIRQVFSVSKTGKVAGCMVTSGLVKRGAKVRLLRDDVVIHEGTLKTLRRFKDEVKEVREGFECGMAFENYDDIREGDMIEAFEIEEKARELDTA